MGVPYLRFLIMLFCFVFMEKNAKNNPQMDPDMYYHSYLGFFPFLVISNDISFFGYIQWTLKAVPDMLGYFQHNEINTPQGE
jgi:hypothetical protein